MDEDPSELIASECISKSTSSWTASDDHECLKRQSQDPQVVKLLAV